MVWLASYCVILWGNGNPHEWVGMRTASWMRTTSLWSFKPFSREYAWTECLTVRLSSKDWTCWGLREAGGGKLEGSRGRWTSRGRLQRPTVNTLQLRQQCWHQTLILWYPDLFVMTENGFSDPHLWSPCWNSWEVLLSDTTFHCPLKYIHTCQTTFGNHGLAVHGDGFQSPSVPVHRLQLTRWILWVQLASVRRQGRPRDSSDRLPLPGVGRQCSLGLCIVGYFIFSVVILHSYYLIK